MTIIDATLYQKGTSYIVDIEDPPVAGNAKTRELAIQFALNAVRALVEHTSQQERFPEPLKFNLVEEPPEEAE